MINCNDFFLLQNLFFFYSNDEFIVMKRKRDWAGLKRVQESRDAFRLCYEDKLAKAISPLIKERVFAHDLHGEKFLPLKIEAVSILEYILAPYEFASYMLFLEDSQFQNIQHMIRINLEDAYQLTLQRFQDSFQLMKSQQLKAFYQENVERWMNIHHDKALRYLDQKLEACKASKTQELI